MTIGVVGPFNPYFISDYFKEAVIPNINEDATAVNTLVRELLESGEEVIVFTEHSHLTSGMEILRGNNIVIYLIASGLIPSLLGYHQFGLGQLYLFKRIAKVIEKERDRLDVLHAHWTYEYARAASLFSDKIPVYDTVRDWCPYQLSIMKGLNRFEWQLKSISFRKVMDNNNITFIANSDYTRRKIVEAYPQKIVPIIPNPIDKRWILDKKKNIIRHQIISIATGLLSSRKNIGNLLKAFALYRQQYSDATLHLVGSYDINNDIYKNWEKEGLLQGVVLYGSMPHDKLSSLLDKMSCLVHPSLEETFGNILLEAMARCVPCIGGDDAGAVPDVLGYGRYGLLCDIKNPKDIYETMVKMDDKEIVEKIMLDATEMLKANYSSDIIAKRHIDLFIGSARA